jgi:hypothetical protein
MTAMRRLLVLLSLIAFPAFAGRTTIRLPDGCAFTATENGQTSPPSVCAEMLLMVKKSFERSPFAQSCGDWPDLEAAARGAAVPGLAFLPLGRAQFLMQVRCTSGAYNESSLFFLWDDRTHEVAPPLVLFPSEGSMPEAQVFARDFEPKRPTLWELRKQLGDGSGGRYRRFTFKDALPVLEEQIDKDEADHLDGYNFSRKQVPHGAKWKRTTPKSSGCLATLTSPACRGPAASKADEAVRAVLASQQEGIVGCVVSAAGADTQAEGWKQSIKVTVVLKHGGALFAVDTVLDPEGPKSGEVKACIDKVVRGVTWPATDAPLLSLERSWALQ